MNDFGLLIGRFLSSFPTLSNEQLSELMLDSSGRLIISGRWLEDSMHVSGDAGLFAMGVRDDGVQANATVGPNVFTAVNFGPGGNAISLVFDGVDDVTTVVAAWNAANPNNQVSFTGSGATVPSAQTVNLVNGAFESVQTSDNRDYSPISVDKYGRLKVAADVSIDPSAAEFAEDSPNSSGDVGIHVLTVRQDTLATSTSTNGDYADFKVNALGELYVHDTDVKAQLVLANSSLDAIEASVASIDIDTSSIITELQLANTSLDNIESDADQIRVDTTAIRSEIESLSHVEDTPHSSGHVGSMPLAVRRDADTSLVDTDGDYAPLQVNAEGRLKTAAELSPAGDEFYVVTDALAAGGDGLVSITASGTPWITVASLSHTSGNASIYGYQWACDQNADARIVTDDGADIVVYKRSLNSSAMPTWSEHWSESGRIEIAGTAGLEIKLQVKKRSATGGNALGTGSIHIRK